MVETVKRRSKGTFLRKVGKNKGLGNLHSVLKLTDPPVGSAVQAEKPFRENWMKMNPIARKWNCFLKIMRIILQKYKPVLEIYKNIFSPNYCKCKGHWIQKCILKIQKLWQDWVTSADVKCYFSLIYSLTLNAQKAVCNSITASNETNVFVGIVD